MYWDPRVEPFIITWMASAVFISLFILILLYFGLPKRTIHLTRRCAALLVRANRMIDMNIPIDEQSKKFIDPYSTMTETEVLHPCDEVDRDYFQSILLTSDVAYFPVRETTFQVNPKFQPEIVTDLNRGTYSNRNKISFI